MVASGIVPVSFHKGKIYFLFGKENELEDSAKGWSDFGGGVEKGETPLQTATREGSEELTGFLGSSVHIKKLLKNHYKLEHEEYHIHIVKLPLYDKNLPIYYNNNHRFLWDRMDKHMLNDTKLFEKIEIQWFSESDLVKKRHLFRCFYKEKVDYIRENIAKIRAHFRSSSKTRKNRKSNNKSRRL